MHLVHCEPVHMLYDWAKASNERRYCSLAKPLAVCRQEAYLLSMWAELKPLHGTGKQRLDGRHEEFVGVKSAESSVGLPKIGGEKACLHIFRVQ